jgi:hypothetical protein
MANELSAEARVVTGTWRSDRDGIAGIRTFGKVTLKFASDGTLLSVAGFPLRKN